MTDWNTVCKRLCKKLRRILDKAGMKESDWEVFFKSKEYGGQIEEFVAEKAREFQESKNG